jgi:hypothetical protein
MWKLLRSLALCPSRLLPVTLLALCAVTIPALAQRSPAPRMFNDQQTHYLRFTVSFNSCVLAAPPSSCSVKVGAVPYNAFMIRAYQQVTTAFAGATVANVAFGTASGSANLVAAQSVLAAGGATALTIVAANAGITVTGNGIAQTGALGGFDIWATINITVAPLTAGQATYVFEYIAPNDGSCTPVPTGATAPAC